MLEQQVSNWQGRTVNYYRCLRLLGQGGMGEVWLAEDQRDQRQVALKLLPGVLASEEGQRHLFKREARIAASLNHPSILAVYDFGETFINEDEVVCYLTMPCVTGGTLRDRIYATGGLSPAEGLRYLRQAAQAIDYLHSQHVLHRDIKPANMLLDGEQLLLSDFGIARLLNSDTHRSRTHAGAGTPEYMAPEQIRSKAEAASDRYSLGVIAYQIFVGSLPFKDAQPFEIMLKQVKDQPPLPHLLNPKLSPQVESVLLKALAKQPAERYESCNAFVDALEQALQGQQVLLASETVMTRPQPVRDVTDIITAPQPAVLSLADPASSPSQEPATLTMAPMRLGSNQTLTHNSAMTSEQKTLVGQFLSTNKFAGKLGRRTLLIGGVATALVIAGGSTAAITLLDRKTILQPQPPGPQQFTPGSPLIRLTAHKDNVENAVWDPSGRYLATAGKDTHVMLWDIGPILQKNPTSLQIKDEPTRKWKFTEDIQGNQLHWTSDGHNIIVSGVSLGEFTLVNPFSNTGQQQNFSDSSFNPDNLFPPLLECTVSQPHANMLAAIVFTQTEPAQVSLWQPNKPKTPAVRLSYTSPDTQSKQKPFLITIAWSCDGTLLAGQLSSQEIVIWNAKTRAVQTKITLPPIKGSGSINVLKIALAWSPTNPHLLAAFNIDAVSIIDVQQSKVLYQLTTDEAGALSSPPKDELEPGTVWYPHVVSISWSPNGRYITASYARSTRVHVWDLQAKQNKIDKEGRRLQHYLIPPANTPSVHGSSILDVNWSPDGRYLATSSYDFTTIIWKVDAK
jgi:serine/threonine protein kinase